MAELGAKQEPKARLVAVGSSDWRDQEDLRRQDDEITRACRISRIRWLAKAYRLQIIVEQHCFGLPGIDSLSPAALVALHKDMEAGRDCYAEGISLEDAGLIRSSYQEAV